MFGFLKNALLLFFLGSPLAVMAQTPDGLNVDAQICLGAKSAPFRTEPTTTTGGGTDEYYQVFELSNIKAGTRFECTLSCSSTGQFDEVTLTMSNEVNLGDVAADYIVAKGSSCPLAVGMGTTESFNLHVLAASINGLRDATVTCRGGDACNGLTNARTVSRLFDRFVNSRLFNRLFN